MSLSPQTIEILVENHKRFLAFLVPRVGSEETAEEVLQEAFVRGLVKGDSLRSEERIVAWFFRILRNAIIDRHRRRAAETRMLAQHEHEPGWSSSDASSLEAAVCACVVELASTLKPEYAAILKSVDLESKPVAAFAKEHGLSANNASVRLHRARQALARRVEDSCGTCCRHGCFDCECQPGDGL